MYKGGFFIKFHPRSVNAGGRSVEGQGKIVRSTALHGPSSFHIIGARVGAVVLPAGQWGGDEGQRGNSPLGA
jgi:hypothetical protein